MQAETEQVRSTLLSSVSHDLRTPLAVIAGASSSLLRSPSFDGATRRGLLETIADEADRLHRLLENILQMSKLETGGLAANKQWHVLEEVVGSALDRARRELAPDVRVESARRPPAGLRRRGAAGAGVRQPPGERRPLHPGRDQDFGHAGPTARGCRSSSATTGRASRGMEERVREVHPGDAGRLPAERARPGHLPGRGAGPRRDDDRLEPPRRRGRVRAPAPAGRAPAAVDLDD